MFKALVLRETDGKVTSAIETLDDNQLPQGNVTVKISHTTINYKDGMVVNGIGRLVREYPHVSGIDFAGAVVASSDDRYAPGDQVVLTGWRVGEAYWGGHSQMARVNGDWLVPLPKGLSAEQAMAIGTAGFTAGLALKRLEDQGLTPDKGKLLITGAAGGVGSVATAVASAKGYHVAASTGRESTHDYIKDLGADGIIDRNDLSEPSNRPLEKELWAGCIDSVGGTTLARVLAQMAYGSSVAAVGLAGGNTMSGTVLPFLLRGVNILGIDSVMCPFDERTSVWQTLAEKLPMDKLESMIVPATMEDIPNLAKAILKGEIKGRVVITCD